MVKQNRSHTTSEEVCSLLRARIERQCLGGVQLQADQEKKGGERKARQRASCKEVFCPPFSPGAGVLLGGAAFACACPVFSAFPEVPVPSRHARRRGRCCVGEKPPRHRQKPPHVEVTFWRAARRARALPEAASVVCQHAAEAVFGVPAEPNEPTLSSVSPTLNGAGISGETSGPRRNAQQRRY